MIPFVGLLLLPEEEMNRKGTMEIEIE